VSSDDDEETDASEGEPVTLTELLQSRRGRQMPVASSASEEDEDASSSDGGSGARATVVNSHSLSFSSSTTATTNSSSSSFSSGSDCDGEREELNSDVSGLEAEVMDAEDLLADDGDDISLFSTERDPPSSSFSSDVFDGRDYEINNVVDIASTILERSMCSAFDWFGIGCLFLFLFCFLSCVSILRFFHQ
jgi:hypothetical protein